MFQEGSFLNAVNQYHKLSTKNNILTNKAFAHTALSNIQEAARQLRHENDQGEHEGSHLRKSVPNLTNYSNFEGNYNVSSL